MHGSEAATPRVTRYSATASIQASQEYVREALREIAEAVGTVAGAVSPLEPAPDTFGLSIGR